MVTSMLTSANQLLACHLTSANQLLACHLTFATLSQVDE